MRLSERQRLTLPFLLFAVIQSVAPQPSRDNFMKSVRFFLSSFLLVLLLAAQFAAQQQTAQSGSGLLTLDTAFTYQAQALNTVQWQADGSGYLTLEPSASKRDAPDIVRYDAASGERTILISAENLVPPGAAAALTIEDFEVSPDGQKLLLFTNTARVWRSNTRGDYWVVDLKTWKLNKLGGSGAKSATLMFAKFSPDGTRVGYVRENNIYVEDLDTPTPRITQITTDGARYIVKASWRRVRTCRSAR